MYDGHLHGHLRHHPHYHLHHHHHNQINIRVHLSADCRGGKRGVKLNRSVHLEKGKMHLEFRKKSGKMHLEFRKIEEKCTRYSPPQLPAPFQPAEDHKCDFFPRIGCEAEPNCPLPVVLCLLHQNIIENIAQLWTIVHKLSTTCGSILMYISPKPKSILHKCDQIVHKLTTSCTSMLMYISPKHNIAHCTIGTCRPRGPGPGWSTRV